jgi:uncharacterized protein YukE
MQPLIEYAEKMEKDRDSWKIVAESNIPIERLKQIESVYEDRLQVMKAKVEKYEKALDEIIKVFESIKSYGECYRLARTARGGEKGLYASEKEIYKILNNPPLVECGIGIHKIKAWVVVKPFQLAQALTSKVAKPVVTDDTMIDKMEDLYGGLRDFPHTTEENEEAVLEIWNRAVKECLKIVADCREAIRNQIGDER